jgi:N-hydroxyarylamine O-acetyltransferase
LLLAVGCPGSAVQWLADVGFGDSFLEPLAFEVGSEQADPTGRYRIQRAGGELELLRRSAEGAWEAEHRFGAYAHELASFRAMCRYHQTSPRSPFTKRRVCSLATPTGRRTLRDDRLIVTEAGRRWEHPIAGEEAFREALAEHFGVRLPGSP